MPLIDRRSNLTPANGRAADVAHRLTEDIIPLQQQRMMAAFRVQGVQAILYNRLNTGYACPCKSKEKTVAVRLGKDGRADPGAINEVLTGEPKFGVRPYAPLTPDTEFEEFSDFGDGPTSPNNQVSQFMGDLIKGGEEDGFNNLITTEAFVGSVGQTDPEIDDLYKEYDLGSIGLSDVSCPICFGSGYIGGYTPFRAWRRVVAATEIAETSQTLDLPSMGLRAGTHSFDLVLPRGAVVLDAFRVMNGKLIVPARILIDGTDTANKRVLQWFDGTPHKVTIDCPTEFTHFEAQAGLSKEPIYFEFPKRGRSGDISQLEKMEPFQIIVSPDVPQLDTLDVIMESQEGKALVVQSTNPWNSRNNQFLGWECMVRVAQPQELYYLLPSRSPFAGQRSTNAVVPSKQTTISGLSAGGTQGFTF